MQISHQPQKPSAGKRVGKAVLFTVLIIFGIQVVVGLLIPSSSGPASPSTTSTAAPAPQPTPPPAPAIDYAKLYNGANKGMTKDAVLALANGIKPTNCTELTDSYVGKYESCYWDDSSFTDGVKDVTMNFQNDKLDSKSKTGF